MSIILARLKNIMQLTKIAPKSTVKWMKMSGQEFELGVKINPDTCSHCAVCVSLCPYEAIEEKFTDKKLEEVSIDPEKCQACGICTSACPSSAIETVYYETRPLLEYANKLIQKTGVSNLVVACKGNGPSTDEIAKLSVVKAMDRYVTLRVPCLGRISPELMIQIVASGVNQLAFVPCEEDLCKFKDGSKIATRRILLIQVMLGQLGYAPNIFTVEENSVKAEIDSSNCITCLNCLYACKYDAIKLDGSTTPKVDEEKCVGCGVCVGLCPALTIRMKGFDYSQILDTITEKAKEIQKLKAEGKGPYVLVMYCQWCNFELEASSENILIEKQNGHENVTYIALPCAGRLDSLHVIHALSSGFDGVLAVGCKKDNCKMDKINGNDRAETRIMNLKALLKQVNLESKINIDFVRPEYLNEFSDCLNSFIEKLKN